MDALRQAVAAGFRDPDRLRLAIQGPLARRADFIELRQAVQRAWAAASQPDPGAMDTRHRPPAESGPVRSAQAQENQAAARHAIGMVLLDLGQVSAAAEHLEQALGVRRRLVEDGPTSPGSQTDLAETLMQLAELDWKAGRPDRARDWWAQAAPLLAQAVAQRPDDPRTLKDLVVIRAALGQAAAAATALARLLELTPESHRPAIVMDLARLDQKAGRRDEARRWWSQAEPILARAVAQQPGDRRAWKELGIARAELGQAEAAATAFAKFVELTPQSKDGDLWYMPDPAGIGKALAAYDGIFPRVVRMRPRHWNLLLARFHYFGRRGRWKEAAEMAARILELDSDDGWASLYRRNLLFYIGDLEGFRRESRGKPLYRDGTMAIEGIPEGRTTNSAWPTGPPSLADADYREGRYAETIRLCEETLKMIGHPYRVTMAHLHLAMVHQRLGHPTEARRELDDAQKGLEGLGRVFWDGPPDLASGERMDYGWTEWIHARIVCNEAEALIVYDPIFPSDPFAR
jgi:tetratricopeptide (TPR) repeat protein